jgi:hypothetical protein
VKTIDVPVSCRHRNTVFYMRSGRQCERKHIVPAEPGTPAHRRVRGTVTAAAKASINRLTDESREA